MYKCLKCGETFSDLPKGLVRCPSCAYKVIEKLRDPLTSVVKAE